MIQIGKNMFVMTFRKFLLIHNFFFVAQLPLVGPGPPHYGGFTIASN
jgi:hypothetical protein